MERSIMDHYSTLGISRSAVQEDIKKAFKKLAVQWHPDRHPAHLKTLAHQKFIAVTLAYEVLGNACRRQEYDLARKKNHNGQSAAESRTSQWYESYRQYAKNAGQWQAKAKEHADKLAKSSYKIFIASIDEFSDFVKNGVFEAIDGFISGKSLYKKSIRACFESIDKDPKDADGYYGLGFLYFKKGDYETSIRCYKKVLTLSPEDADAYFGLGMARERMDDLEKAANCYSKTCDLRPFDADAWFRLGCVYARAGDVVLAEKCIQHLESLKRKDLASKISCFPSRKGV